jgi:prophage antirepressor-like protein
MEDKALQVFSFESQTVRVVTVEGEPWWVAKDVCDILGYANSRDAVETHCKHSGKHTVANRDGITRNPETTIIPESDMYRLIIRSHLPEAERFEVWVMEEVLPSIRKHGAYLTPVTLENALADPRSIAQILYKLADEREAKSRALAALEEARENNEILETALNSALQWRTVMQYNT